MKKLIFLLVAAPLLLATTCDHDLPDYDRPCTAEAVAGLTVNVSLNGQGDSSDEGISVTARDGNYIEDLFPVASGTAVFTGVYERTGWYIVTVRKQGFQDFVSDAVQVTSDRCHVIPQQLSVNLIPE